MSRRDTAKGPLPIFRIVFALFICLSIAKTLNENDQKSAKKEKGNWKSDLGVANASD